MKIQNEFREYRSSIKKLQLQLASDMSKHYNEIIGRLEAKHRVLVQKMIQKGRQDLEEKEPMPPTIEIRIGGLLFGPHGSGKRSFNNRLTENVFREKSPATIYPNFKQKIITRDGKRFSIRFCEWTCGILNDRALPQDHILITFYDITEKKSFTRLQHDLSWMHRVRGKAPVVFLVGTKSDLESQRQVTKREAEEYSKEIEAMHFEVSAKTEENMWEFQEELIKALLAKDWPPEKVIELKKVEEKKSPFWGLFG